MADVTESDWPYVWRCGECGETWPGTGSGHWHALQHAKNVHDRKASECLDGVIDTRTGDVVLEGCGTAVLQKGRRMGVVQGSEEDTAPEPEEQDEAPRSPRSVKPTEDRAPTRRELAELRKLELRAQQTGRVVMKDIVIDRSVLLAFYEAQAIWPDLYPDSSEGSLSAFIRDAVMSFGIMADMFSVTNAVQSAFEQMMGGMEDGSDE